MRFLVADTLTGSVVGQLDPSKWDVTDPLRSPGTGSLTVALPSRHEDVARLAEMTKPRVRWVALQDEQDRLLWCGPIPRSPAEADGEIVIPVQDWRSWFHHAPIRPVPNGSAYGQRRNYIRYNQEQATLCTDLLALALDTPGAPAAVVDAPPATGVQRDVAAYMLERSIGDHLDDLHGQGGPEWWCYCTQPDPTSLLLHATVGWPERATRTSPVLLSWKVGRGGTAAAVSLPEGQDAPTRVWAYGDGQPVSRVFAVSEFPEIADGTEVAWETVLSPPGVVKSAAAFDHADAAIDRSRGLDGTVEVTVVHERLPLGDVATGDRARVDIATPWRTVDLEAARIVSRTLSGGRKQPTQQVLTVDLADDSYPDGQGEPGQVVDG